MKSLLIVASLYLCFSGFAAADVVVTNDGARLTGRILNIGKGIIKLETAYAGIVNIDQKQVASFTTDEEVLFQVSGDKTLVGKPAAGGEQGFGIQSGDVFHEVAIKDVDRVLPVSGEDSARALEAFRESELKRKWHFSGGFDFLGKKGNSEDFSIGGNFEAKLKGEHDVLAFSAAYENREKDGSKTADRSTGGVSYEVFRKNTTGWYLRSEIERDAITSVDLRSTSAGGFSYRFLNEKDHTLIARLGPGYRYTAYEGNKEDESSMTLDLGLAHNYRFNDFLSIKTDITYVPGVIGSGNDRLVQDSGLVFPLAGNRKWKVRMGIRNEFESEPAVSENLDTTYYTRIIYSWD